MVPVGTGSGADGIGPPLASSAAAPSPSCAMACRPDHAAASDEEAMVDCRLAKVRASRAAAAGPGHSASTMTTAGAARSASSSSAPVCGDRSSAPAAPGNSARTACALTA